MSKQHVWAFAALAALALANNTVRANVISLAAGDNATVQPGGPRPGDNGKAFFNMEGANNGAFASFGVIDFDTSGIHATDVTSASLQLTQANAGFTTNGELRFFLAPDTTTDIQPGTSPLKFLNSSPDGVDLQLGKIALLGSATFTQGAGGPDGDGSGMIDLFNFGVTPSVAALLESEINAGKVRIVVAPLDRTVAATYAGFSNDEFAGPTLSLGGTLTAVPEPASLTLAGLGFLGLVVFGRRRFAQDAL